MALNQRMQMVARRAADLLGGGSAPDDVKRYNAPDSGDFMDVARFAASPSPGLTAYTTLGLSAAPLLDHGREFPARVEICGAADDEYDKFAGVVATAAFDVMGGEFIYPDRILVDVVATYYPDYAARHALFVQPSFWDPGLTRLDADGRTVLWLQLVPVTDSEVAFAKSNGSEALVKRLIELDAKPSDLQRAPVA
ncbi:suppressor of fused domain protein [Glycomyces sp. NPDC047010]|uniref:suppressor of fused domain protein n=1 Tax=Glycomyces sp. NPDC047010 TaxID=3155023 RepID=UPI003403BDEC